MMSISSSPSRVVATGVPPKALRIHASTSVGVSPCKDDFNPGQANADADGLGDLCDLCPSVDNSGHTAGLVNGDVDGNGMRNGCDCDLDGDGCLNPGFELGADGLVSCQDLLDMRDLQTFQGEPFHDANITPGDFDMDGTPNRCDADLDGDLVPNGVDNCPLGDGDASYEPGVDDDPDQTDSGGPPQGDLCDPFCNSSGAPICGLAPGDFGPGAGGLPGGLPPGASRRSNRGCCAAFPWWIARWSASGCEPPALPARHPGQHLPGLQLQRGQSSALLRRRGGSMPELR